MFELLSGMYLYSMHILWNFPSLPLSWDTQKREPGKMEKVNEVFRGTTIDHTRLSKVRTSVLNWTIAH